jgi:uncharacterized protein (DUF1810 family)
MELDRYNLQRFIQAQEPVYKRVVSELREGRKRTHWMWFIFPQIRGLGQSEISQRFSIGSLYEAEAYSAHPILGPRLKECTQLVNAIQGRSIEDIFGYPDHLKFRSSMTLFAQAAPGERVFNEALDKYFAGAPDDFTLSRLAR